MDTKWKSKSILSVWALMVTLGISGIIAILIHGGQYIHRDYFHTGEFQSELDQFAGYEGLFELNNLTLEEAKKTITVTEDEINEHRYRYGSLPEQIANIKAQYEERINGAMDANDQEAADSFKEARDAKIADITNNFKSDDYVRPKVVKEKETRIEDYYKKRETLRTDYLRYKETFLYYFTNTETGKVYTNLKETSSTKELNKENMLFVSDMTITRDNAIYFGIPQYEGLADSFIPSTIGTLEGKVAIPKSLSFANSMMIDYKNYQQRQMLLLIYSLAGLVALIVSLYISRKSKIFSTVSEKWRPFYNRLPIDVRAFFFILAGVGTMITIFGVSDQLIYVFENPYDCVEIVIGLMIGAFLWGLTYVQWKFLKAAVTNGQNVKAEWNKGVVVKGTKRLRVVGNNTIRSFREAFLNQSTGTQLFIVIGMIFALGLAAVIITIHPILIVMYLLILMFIGIPLVMVLVNKIGYFNKIIEKTNELAVGNLGDNLEVTGKSILATLASNINVLNQGVKQSQNEQAKSERLKTELITNVSHDLRTPLTSIITYTELLKTENLSSEDKSAYLEIIDRKSKRLKVLIDDLFEVSKMASGTIQLTKEKVDLVQLLQQSLAEYDDTIKESNLQFRVTTTEEPVYALVDGQKLWRVFENLIGNILKYSLEQSRVYIQLLKKGGQATITFKNVSKYELSDTSDELFERFKRGDQSRHTEGSGLGLAIAKSIVDLHEGKLDIETDGDLFKVIISLKLEG